jgi:hypothetical protein
LITASSNFADIRDGSMHEKEETVQMIKEDEVRQKEGVEI